MSSHDLLSVAQLAEMMHKASVRPTAQRLSILRCVVECRKHPTADDIFNDLRNEYPTMSFTTVYNSLRVLTEAGLLRELEIERGNRRYDFALQPRHGHLRCRRCGRILDIEIPEELRIPSPPGFSIDGVDILFRGICPECADQA